MRYRTLVFAFLLFGFGLMTGLSTPNGSSIQTATAQASGDRAIPRIAVVDFTRLGARLMDVELINELVAKYRELLQVRSQALSSEISDLEEDIETLERDGFDLELREREEELRELSAQLRSLELVTEFNQKRKATQYFSGVMEKVLQAISDMATGQFDIVFKVLGDADASLEGMQAEAQSINLANAREILFYEPGTIADRTNEVAERMQRRTELTDQLQAEIQSVSDEIAQYQ